MSSPSRSTFPSARAFGIVSCIRLRQRMRVDLPQPEGPMIAVTSCSANSIPMSWIAFFGPYQAERPSTWILIVMGTSFGHGPEADDDPRSDADREHDEDEDQGRAPRGLVLRARRAQAERVDRVGQRFHRLVQAREAIEAPERGHKE